MPLATAIASTAMGHARYGNAHPHTVLPFAVGHASGINEGGMKFSGMCRDAADNKRSLNARASDLSSDPGPARGSLTVPAVTAIS